MAYTTLTCTNAECTARGQIQTGTVCAVCGEPTSWAVQRGGPVLVSPWVTPPRAGAKKAGVETHTCMTEGCPRFHLAQDDLVCGACGTPTVLARTT